MYINCTEDVQQKYAKFLENPIRGDLPEQRPTGYSHLGFRPVSKIRLLYVCYLRYVVTVSVMPVYLFLKFYGPTSCMLTADRTHQRVCHA